jgi:formylglycine-generating enzyme required for sulfatase activity
VLDFALVATHSELRERLQGGSHELIHVCGRTGSLTPLDDGSASEQSGSGVFEMISKERLEIEANPNAVELRCVVLTGVSPFSRMKPKPVADVALTIAMPGTLEHGPSLVFARVFYAALAAGLEIESAYKEGVVGATDHEEGGAFESMLFRAGEMITTRTPFDELRMLKDSARTISARILAVQNQLSRSSSLSVGDLLAGRFVLQQLAAFGGFCEIWKTYDRESREIVAVKIMHDAWARDAHRVACFEQAALSMSQLHHPAIAEVISSVERDHGRRFFVMRWYDGGNLRGAVERGDHNAALRACADAIDGLAHAHKRHLLHRDIKPHHVLLDELGHGHLCDFDLSTDHEAQPGMLRGTTAAPYAAPEMRVELDARADLYGMAMCVLFALLGEDPPIDDPIAGIEKLDDCTKELDEALRGALAFDKRDRTATLAVLADAVRKFIDTPAAGPPRTAAGWIEQGEDQFGRWATFEFHGVQQRMRWIKPGKFSMGSSSAADMSHIEGWRQPVPVHSVTLSQGFWLAETECTQALWEAVMGNNPSQNASPQHPVEAVSWNDVQQFLAQLNKLVGGLAFKLPTEAQWEYACRADTNTNTYSEALGEIAWYAANSNQTNVVRQKRCNQWGLYDTLGNVWEWCEDPPRTYHGGSVVDPVGAYHPQARVVRGGGWLSSENFGVRAADRMVEPPTTRDARVGFRLARLPR